MSLPSQAEPQAGLPDPGEGSGPGRSVPTATYRLQLHPAFTFDQAAEQVEYLAALGVSHGYLSPVLQATPGSTHGYDVVCHDLFNEELGTNDHGGTGFTRLARTFELFGLGVVLDVVPNHMATPTPGWLNTPWWSLLRDGPTSEAARWFDVDWAVEDGRILLPVLGRPLEQVLAAGELATTRDGGWHGDEVVLRHFDHAFPVRPGTEDLPLADLVAAQHYRLADWRAGQAELNYRRFFDVTTLAAIRVEDRDVFDATHRLLLETYRAGLVHGFRIDHPDGLHDPQEYLVRLAGETGGAWVVAEKILEGDEQLPATWQCAGTTGYDTLQRVSGVFVDPSGRVPLTRLATELVGAEQDLPAMVREAKAQVVETVQAAEVNRLLRLLGRILPGNEQDCLRRGLGALLVAMDRYRAYVDPDAPDAAEGEQERRVLVAAEHRARDLLGPGDQLALQLVAELARGVRLPEAAADTLADQREFVVRFQQTCGPVMAKGVEDTTFYRHVRLTGLNEVGGDPDRVGVSPQELHEFAARQLVAWPTTMTTLSTHDTKRSEDVRARLAVLAELPQDWEDWLRRARRLAARHRGDLLDGATEYLLWQTAVGAWPIEGERLQAYATKAVREAKVHTGWSDPDAAYEAEVARFVDGLTGDAAIGEHLDAWTDLTASASRVNILGQKLLQLVLPGVPDVYQGTELVDLSLVDPDNRRLVDYTARRARLTRLDAGERPADLDDEKLLVTSRTLRLRRDHPQWFTGPRATYAAVPATTDHVLAVGRGDEAGPGVIALVSRFGERLERSGGWQDQTVQLPRGEWHDLLTGRAVASRGAGGTRVGRVLADLPVALLVGHGSLSGDDHA